jgi:hypothetical protein
MSAPGGAPHLFAWRMSTNSPRGWRQRVAQWLHLMAQRLDGRHSLAIDFECQPQIAPACQRAVLVQALKQAQTLLHDEVQAAAVEQRLRADRPELYRDRQHG